MKRHEQCRLRGAVEVEEEREQRRVEDGVEHPAGHPLAAAGGEVEPQHHHGGGEAEEELHDLQLGDGALPAVGPAQPHAAGEVVGVHDDVHAGVGDERDGHQGLARGEPEVAHGDDDGVVVDVEQRERAAGQQDEQRVAELVHLGEVEDVRPEEDRARRLRGAPRREAEGPRPPSRRRRRGGRGERAPGGHGGGERQQDRVVGGGCRAERRRRERRDARQDEAAEDEHRGEVAADDGGREGRRRADRAAWLPAERGHRRVLHQEPPHPAQQRRGRHRSRLARTGRWN
ncbi:hypothetical protein BDA96_01G129800 [Sorghum bicolor]|uniref:Uncharacterized protein n=1 Tax=Sorghum bicolor TaxID=4558 RepID=A0A921UY05_SORBI|nr:hypothetical protein BDA96_01G129800 [Sorghum bicolor]